jgi:integral membrane protein (TIGR01906 family)
MALKVFAKWLFIVCLPVLLLTATIAGLANSLWLYRHGFHEYGVREELAEAGLPLSDSQLEGIYAGLISYYNSGEECVNITVVSGDKTIDFFTPEEVIHFRDVKGLIRLDYRVLLGMLVYVLAYAGVSLFWWQDRRLLARGLVWGSILTLALILALVLLDTLSGFGQLFYDFHLLFFSNLFWLTEGYMLMIFPEQFFDYAATLGAGIIVGAAVILGGVGWHLKRAAAPEGAS